MKLESVTLPLIQNMCCSVAYVVRTIGSSCVRLLVQNMTSVATLISVNISMFKSVLFTKLTKVLRFRHHAYTDVCIQKLLHIFNIFNSVWITSQLIL